MVDFAEHRASCEMVIAAFQGKAVGARWVRTACPNCLEEDGKEDVKLSLGYLHSTGGFNCFRCGMSGRLTAADRDEIGEEQGYQPPTRVVAPQPEAVPTADGYMSLTGPVGSDERLKWAHDYLTGRGISPATIRSAQIGASVYGNLAGRIIIPVPDYEDASAPWKGWIARRVFSNPATPWLDHIPYLNAKGMNRETMMLGEPALWVQTTIPVFIVEGPMDALALWPHAVAALGKPVPAQHAKLVACRHRPLVVCLDGDAWQEGQALAWSLTMYGISATNLRLPPKQDPNNLGLEGVMRLYEQTISS